MLSKLTRGALGATLALLMAAPALAGGYQVQQQGAKASGRGGAFTAQADDASATFYNPAAVGQLEGWNVYVGGTLLSMSDTTFEPTGGGSFDMQDSNVYAGNVYVTGPIGDRYAFAVGAFVPFALRTHWFDSDPVAGSSLKASWDTREYNVNGIAKLTDEWSVALGLEWVRMVVDDLSSAYDFERLEPFLFPPTEPLTATRNFSFSGDKAGVNVAIHYRGENGYRFGLSFRSQKIVRMKGMERWQDVSEATFLTTTNVINDAGCAANPTFCPMGAAFTDAPAEAVFVLPGTIQLGFGQEGIGQFDWEVNILATGWENVDSLDAEVDGLNGVRAGLAIVPTTISLNQTEEWSDTIALFAGGDYHINDAHSIRFGLAYDQTPVQEEFTRPYNPDADKIGVTAGYGWAGLGGKIKVDGFAQYWIYAEAEPSSDPAGANVGSVVGGTYDTTVVSAGASFQYKF